MDQHRIKCPYLDCKDCERAGAGNVVKWGMSPQARQRFRCRTCGRTFSETTGSVWYRLKSPRARIGEAVRRFAQGDGVTRIARQMRVKPQTVGEWLTKAFSLPGAGEALGLTSQRMDELRNRFARVKAFHRGGRQMVHSGTENVYGTLGNGLDPQHVAPTGKLSS